MKLNPLIKRIATNSRNWAQAGLLVGCALASTHSYSLTVNADINTAGGRIISGMGAGLFKGTFNATSPNPGLLGGDNANDFWGFCLEPTEYLKSSFVDYEFVDLTDAPNLGPGTTMPQQNADLMSRLAGTVFDWRSTDGSFTALGQSSADTALGGSTSLNTLTGALQLAVWELSYERSNPAAFGLSTGTFTSSKGTSDMRTLADAWIDLALDGLDGTGGFLDLPDVKLHAITRLGNQDYLVATAVPLPGALLFFGTAILGWLGYGAARRR